MTGRRLVREGFFLILVLLPAWAMAQNEIISFTRSDGGVSVVVPAEACLSDLQQSPGALLRGGSCPALGHTRAQALAWIRQRDVPSSAVDVSIHDRSQLPDRRFRDAWRKTGGTMGVDMPTARDIRAREVREQIQEKLTQSERDGQVALDEGKANVEAQHRAYRVQLRLVRTRVRTDLDALSTPDELKAWSPAYPPFP